MSFSVNKGNDLRVIVPVADNDGVPVDISGALEITVVIADTLDAETARLTKVLTGGDITIVNTTDFMFDLPAAETAGLPVGNYYVEGKLVNSAGKQYTVLIDSLTVNPVRL